MSGLILALGLLPIAAILLVTAKAPAPVRVASRRR
jgi:hypothetical protein